MKKQINQIQSLSGVTQSDFQRLYISTIERFIGYLKEPNRPSNELTMGRLLDLVILALKRRQGYLLPLGSDSETSFREREEWTFAVFSAALFQSVDVTVRLAVAKAILPVQGFAWLHRNSILFESWTNYLQEKNQGNIFNDIVGDVSLKNEIRLSVKQTEKVRTLSTSCPNSQGEIKSNNEMKKRLVTEDQQEKSGYRNTIASDQSLKYVLPNNAIIKEVDLTQPSIEKEKKPPLSNPHQSDHSLSKTAFCVPDFKVEDFWQWLKESIIDHTITINQVGSVVHKVAIGVLICIPAALDRFLSSRAKQLHVEEISTMPLSERIRLTKAIKKNEQLIRNDQGSRIHTYYLGKWEDRQVMSGVVIKHDALLGDEMTLPINSALTIDPIDSA